jgi:hypothetical protein
MRLEAQCPGPPRRLLQHSENAPELLMMYQLRRWLDILGTELRPKASVEEARFRTGRTS